jgi:ribosomal protein S18 acetylase RimI-like enzyme
VIFLPVKKVSVEDLPEISQLIAETFPYTSFTPEKLAERLDQGIQMFKVEEEELIGFIEIELLDMVEQIYRINALQVKEEYRGLHHGQELLQFALKHLKKTGASQVILLVEKDNEVAKHLYHEFGFQFLKKHDKLINGKEVEELLLQF